MITQTNRVRNALVGFFIDKEFPRVVTDSNGSVSASDQVETPNTPIICNEISCSFEEDLSNGMGLSYIREDWVFTVRLKFSNEVSLDRFDQEFLKKPIIVPADRENDLPQVILRLSSRDTEHPIQKSSQRGSDVTYFVEAEEGRN